MLNRCLFNIAAASLLWASIGGVSAQGSVSTATAPSVVAQATGSAVPQGSGQRGSDGAEGGVAASAPSTSVSNAPAAQLPSTKRTSAVRTGSPMRVDGVLDELEWQDADPVSDFLQRDPREGEPASQRTVARILYDDETLFLSFMLYDDDPSSILASDLRRDSSMASDDTIEVVLDTFHDNRNGFIFRVNALGTKYDALLRNEGQVNVDWDEQWDVAARITGEGWVVEMAIPFRALRYDTGASTWGIDFQRQIRRSNEEVAWSNNRRGFRFTNISQAGDLTGLYDLRLAQRFRLTPYVAGGTAQFNQSDVPYADSTGDVGIDNFRVQITPNLTADVTVNTDFAQVEDDSERVNLSRFSLFFPEKREFFLESAENFSFGSGGGYGGPSLSLFNSRNIGLVSGEAVPIKYGAKMTGKVGGTNLGVMNVQTGDSEFGGGENYTAVRAKQDILERSTIGGIFTNVQSGAEYNRVVGFDANFRFLDHMRVSGFAARVDDNRMDDSAWSSSFAAEWNSDRWELGGSYLRVAPDFDSDLGFIRRTDIVRRGIKGGWNPRPEWGGIRQIRIGASFDYLTDTEGELQGHEQGADINLRLESGDSIFLSVDRELDRVDRSFRVGPGIVIPAGDYSMTNFRTFLSTYSARTISGRVSVSGGDYFGGTRYSLSPSGTFRFNENFSLSPRYTYNAVDLPGGAFETHTVSLRAAYNFDEHWLTSTLVQYNSLSGRMSVFARLNYVYRGGYDNVFLVYKQTRMFEGVYNGLDDRALLAKMTYSFDF